MDDKIVVDINLDQPIYALQHIETKQYVCILVDGIDYLVCFTCGDGAISFMEDMRMREHVDLYVTTLNECEFNHFWLDGEFLETRLEIVN